VPRGTAARELATRCGWPGHDTRGVVGVLPGRELAARSCLRIARGWSVARADQGSAASRNNWRCTPAPFRLRSSWRLAGV